MKKIIFKDGTVREITGEDGKYWLTGEDRVRKLSDAIGEVREAEEAAKAEAPKKKTAKKKKKTEDAEDGDCGS